MRFSTKVFLAICLPALSLMMGISAAFYTFLANATRAQFVAHYQGGDSAGGAYSLSA